MLTVSPKGPPSSSSESGSQSNSDRGERVIPRGQPYLTKINGKLVMARDKKPRATTSSKTINLLGEAFGKGEAYGPPRVLRTHRRSASAAPSMTTPLVIGGVTYVPQQSVAYQQPQAIQQQPIQPAQFQHSYPYYLPVPQPQPAPQPQFTYPQPLPNGPTKQDFEHLKQIDAHYNLQKHSSDPALKTRTELVTTSRTTITITRHICAQCGRVRSKKYHRDNPIKPGVEPTPDFCRKCQKDVSETSGSDTSPKKGGNGKKEKGKEKEDNKRSGKKGKSKQKKKGSSSSEDEESGSPKTKDKKHWRISFSDQPPQKEIIRERVTFIDNHSQASDYDENRLRKGSYVRLRPVEVEQHRSRGRRRQRDLEEEAKAYGRPFSPDFHQSDSAYNRYGPRRVVTEPIRQRSPSPTPLYRHVQAPAYHEFLPHDRRRPIRFEEEYEQYYEPEYTIPIRENVRFVMDHVEDYGSNSSRARGVSRTRYANDRFPPKEPSYEDSHSSSRSHGSSEQRRREREADREAERRSEKTDRATIHPRNESKKFAAQEEAENYYNSDWNAREPKLRRRPARTGFRRDAWDDSELGESEVTYDAGTDAHAMPRAPTPPSRPETDEKWKHKEAPPYPFSSESDVVNKRGRKGKAPQRFPSPDQFRPNSRNPSKVRSGAEKAPATSPTRSSTGKGHQRKVSWGEPEYRTQSAWDKVVQDVPVKHDDGYSRISGGFTDIGPGDPSMWGGKEGSEPEMFGEFFKDA